MPKGIPVTLEQKKYIVDNIKHDFISQIANDLDLDRKTIRNVLNKQNSPP